ncbi:hypothetical protein [Aeromicrobium sp.]|uniref:hypothetical protein n=1 Tax=Aeromicrobium sp. TaxID=1871063 RepID=UPI003D6AE76F
MDALFDVLGEMAIDPCLLVWTSQDTSGGSGPSSPPPSWRCCAMRWVGPTRCLWCCTTTRSSTRPTGCCEQQRLQHVA